MARLFRRSAEFMASHSGDIDGALLTPAAFSDVLSDLDESDAEE